ncbi:MAG: hypothetical protein EOP51_32730 [Sphingobacteriales bacterium]|nr:MAG: hypothetical protein EOP51_32730 [Sphingobacteriales bacterium]
MATSQTYTPPNLTASTWFRRIVTPTGTTCSNSTSNEVLVTVRPQITPGAIAGTATLCTGGSAINLSSTSASTGGGTTRTYQWQVSSTSASTGFANVGSASATETFSGNTTTYANGTPGDGPKNYWFRRIDIVDGCSDATTITNVVQITVLSNITNNTLTAPASATLCTGNAFGAITGSTPTGGPGAYTYQWSRSTTSGGTYTTLTGTGTTGISYTPGTGTNDDITNTTAAAISYFYKRTVNADPASTGNCNSNLSSEVQITINPLPKIANKAYTICSGETFSFAPVIGAPDLDVIPAGTMAGVLCRS